jgi:hypothetical protein
VEGVFAESGDTVEDLLRHEKISGPIEAMSAPGTPQAR